MDERVVQGFYEMESRIHDHAFEGNAGVVSYPDPGRVADQIQFGSQFDAFTKRDAALVVGPEIVTAGYEDRAVENDFSIVVDHTTFLGVEVHVFWKSQMDHCR